MENKVVKKERKKVEFKINDITLKRFSETDFKNYGLKESDLDNGGCNIGFKIAVDNNNKMIALSILAEFFADVKDNILFSIETVHEFKIKYFNRLFKKQEGGLYDIPDAILMHLLGIAIGGTRGMIVASVQIPQYKKIFLPLITTSQLLDAYKKEIKTDS